ncbi:MAG: biopolymer transporter ExbD [candidate division Zixibacteria bacterium]|nr:biopolymer transporter ExbD [candidate division Zixibacteria bacterium]
MAVDAPQKEAKGGKKGLRRPKRRISIRIDMTPMVDIAFLLLIFYMVTTIFAAPQAMEINLPPKEKGEERGKVKRRNLLNIYVDGQGDIYYDIGRELTTDEDIKIPWPIPADSIRDLFARYNWERPKLNTLLIIHPDAKYVKMVDLLDEIEVVENVLRHNEEFTKSYKEANPDAGKFSFRYAIDHWTERHDKKIKKAYEAYGGGGD